MGGTRVCRVRRPGESFWKSRQDDLWGVSGFGGQKQNAILLGSLKKGALTLEGVQARGSGGLARAWPWGIDKKWCHTGPNLCNPSLAEDLCRWPSNLSACRRPRNPRNLAHGLWLWSNKATQRSSPHLASCFIMADCQAWRPHDQLPHYKHRGQSAGPWGQPQKKHCPSWCSTAPIVAPKDKGTPPDPRLELPSVLTNKVITRFNKNHWQ